MCDAIVQIALNGKRPIYNVASGVNVTNRELFEMIERHTGCRIAVTEPVGAGDERAPVVDIGALQEDLGLAPQRLSDAFEGLVAANRQPGTAQAAVS